ncbi:Hypothetical predicted protein [Paramuricea clavata]|uniref:Uncharacterized protein n=1 Tax=Paramuricea clavata TaxID=317549 RepID=A0A6S7JA19_PARCT|nr:Hypothetical predicted protein [Paramuricea clavata]
MNRSIFVVFLLVLVAADLRSWKKRSRIFYSSAWRRRRMGMLNNDAKIPKEMKLQREPEPVQSTHLEKEARAMYRMMTNEDRMNNDLHRPDSFVEDDNEL